MAVANQGTVGKCARCKRDLSDPNGVPCFGCIPGSPPIKLPSAPAKLWTLVKPETRDKRLTIKGPGEDITIDYDDVDHAKVRTYARAIVETLNFGWRKAP
jgi:hypothetical protein